MIAYFITFAVLWFVGSILFTIWWAIEYHDNLRSRSFRHYVPMNQRRVRYGLISTALSPLGGLLWVVSLVYLTFVGTRSLVRIGFPKTEEDEF